MIKYSKSKHNKCLHTIKMIRQFENRTGSSQNLNLTTNSTTHTWKPIYFNYEKERTTNIKHIYSLK